MNESNENVAPAPQELIDKAMEQVSEKRRMFPGILMVPHDYTDDPAERYRRAHEKRRLKAYLKGHQRFQHGWQPAFPFGRRPVMFPIYEGPNNDQPTTQQ